MTFGTILVLMLLHEIIFMYNKYNKIVTLYLHFTALFIHLLCATIIFLFRSPFIFCFIYKNLSKFSSSDVLVTERSAVGQLQRELNFKPCWVKTCISSAYSFSFKLTKASISQNDLRIIFKFKVTLFQTVTPFDLAGKYTLS